MRADEPSFGEDPRSTWLRYEVAAGLLRRVLAAFDEARIPALPVKGIVTSAWLYEDASRRPLSDVDLRIRPRDFARALEVGRALGWKLVVHTPRFFEGAFRFPEMDVELEATIGPPGLSTISVDDLLTRAIRRVEPFGVPHLVPETNDHALVLAVNVFKDRLRGAAAWAVEDLVRIATVDDFDAATVAARARAGHVGNAVATVADWVAAHHGSFGWGRVGSALSTRPRRRVYDRFYEAISRRDVPPIVELVGIAAGGDGAVRPLCGASVAVAGWGWGGVMRRVDRLRRA
jgi:Uncharacterised nucleotidyltransferase